jgi:hypothetical protein
VVHDLAAALPEAAVTSTVAPPPGTAAGDLAQIRDDWPYLGSVLALRPLAGGETRVALALPPVPTRFVARAGVDPARWAEFEPGVTELGVSVAEAGGERVLWQAALDPERRYADRRWLDVDVVLPPGPAATLVLWARTDRPGGYARAHAGFETPRLVAAAP